MYSFTDLKLLIMEAAPLGNLRQYLKITANETYYNVTSLKTSDMNFINQIIEGVYAVHHLGVSKYIKFLDGLVISKILTNSLLLIY